MKVQARSAFWRSTAWPDPGDPPYLNAIALVETALDARRILRSLLELEVEFGRRRDKANGPRTLDLDLISFGREVSDNPGLILPHPRAHMRRFVMGPLAEVCPEWRHPILGRTAEALVAEAGVGVDAHPV